MNDLLGTSRLAERQRQLVLAKHGFVMVEIAPQRIAEIIELLIGVGTNNRLDTSASCVCLAAQRIKRVALHKYAGEATVWMTHYRGV